MEDKPRNPNTIDDPSGDHNVEDLEPTELDAERIAGGLLPKNDCKGKGECRTDGKPMEKLV